MSGFKLSLRQTMCAATLLGAIAATEADGRVQVARGIGSAATQSEACGQATDNAMSQASTSCFAFGGATDVNPLNCTCQPINHNHITGEVSWYECSNSAKAYCQCATVNCQ